MPVATQMLLQVALRDIGQLTDIETGLYKTGLALNPGSSAGLRRTSTGGSGKVYFGCGRLL
jgi:hypothetical protein